MSPVICRQNAPAILMRLASLPSTQFRTGHYVSSAAASLGRKQAETNIAFMLGRCLRFLAQL